ncbi:MAG: ABC transporter permease [bacterium]|nr:ABC transporter permease [bacterium]
MMGFIKRLAEKKEKITPLKLPTQLASPNLFVERPPINPFIKLFYAVTKNIKLLIRSKVSALIFIFGPLLIITLVALSFNTSTLFDLNIAAYSESYSTLSDSIITNLSDSQYNILKMNSEAECIDAVKSSDFQVCVIFPPNMVLDNSANNIVKIYVDNSRLNVANLIASQITTKVSIEASQLSSEIITHILTVLDTTNTETIQTQANIQSIIANNEEAQTTTTSIASDLAAIDFSYTNLDTTSLDTEVNSIKGKYNISSTDITNLNSLIDSLETSYNSLGAKLDTSKASVTTLTTSASGITAKLNTEKTNLETATTNLQEISDNIKSIKITNVASIVSPIKTAIEPISSINSYLLYILPTILVLLIMFVALLMSSASIITEKESRAYFRNFITPTNAFLFMAGEFISNFIIIAFQITILLAVIYYFLSTTLSLQTFFIAGFALLATGSFFILLGMLFGYLFNTKQTVTLATISAAMIMLFFSNTILPLETLSIYTRNIVQYNPFIIGETMLKKILLFGSGIGSIAEPLYTLLVFFGILLIVAIIARILSKKYLNRT